MPLKSGSSIETIGGNIGDMIDKYKETGKIGNITPKSMAHAQQIATAAANQKAGDAKPSKAVGSFKDGGMNEGAGKYGIDKESAKHEVAESVKKSGEDAAKRISNSVMIPSEFKKKKK